MVLSLAPAYAANILIVAGTTGTAQTAATVLNADLSGSNTVTIVNTGVPVSLAGYTQIYDVRYDNQPGFSAAEMNQYLAFLNAAAGNTIFLMGENFSFNVRNTPITQFIALAGGGTIAAPASTSANSETLGAAFTTNPNSISTVKFAACGLLLSAGTGAFAASEATGGCAIYFNQQTMANALTGALVVVLDVNFIATAPTGGTSVNEVAFRQNLEAFVAAPPVGAPPKPVVTSIGPASGPLAGGTIVTITGTGFTGTLGVKFGGAQAVSFTVNSDTSITATSPPGAAATVDIIVTTPNGVSTVVTGDQFSFSAGQFIPGVPTPTLSEWAMIALGLLLACGGYLALMKKPFGSRLRT